MIKSYQQLIVWQKSIELVIEVYKITSLFPREELYGITSQMRRAAVAIPSNIAEGFSRKYTKEYSQFLRIAFSSGAELETQIIITKKLELAKIEDFVKTGQLLDEVLKMLNKMSASLNASP